MSLICSKIKVPLHLFSPDGREGQRCANTTLWISVCGQQD